MVAEFVDFLTGATGASDAATSYLRGSVGRSAVIRTGLQLGVTPTRILTGMRAAGLGMRTQNFYQLTHQIAENVGSGAGWTWGGPGTSIDPADINQLEGGSSGKYMVNVKSYYTSVDEEGDLESGYTVTSVLQDELDLDQAVADAQNIQGGRYTGQGGGQGMITGWDISSVSQWQGK